MGGSRQKAERIEAALIDAAIEQLRRDGVQVETRAEAKPGYDAGARRLTVPASRPGAKVAPRHLQNALVWHAVGNAVLDLERPSYLETGRADIDEQMRGEAAVAFALERSARCHGTAGREERAKCLEAIWAKRRIPGPDAFSDEEEARIIVSDARTSGMTAIYARLEDAFSRSADAAGRLGDAGLAQAIRHETGCRAIDPAPEPTPRPGSATGSTPTGDRERPHATR